MIVLVGFVILLLVFMGITAIIFGDWLFGDDK